MKAKIFRTCCMLFVMLAMFTVAPLELSARTLGMVANNVSSPSVTVFDADTHAVLGTVFIPEDGVGDVLITPDLKRGFVANFTNEIFVIDLTTSPPSLAVGTNPILVSSASGADLSISPDGKFLLVADSSSAQSISVIDIAAQAEVSAFSTGGDATSVDVCSEGSVLVTSTFDNKMRRLTLSGTGTLTDTGEALSGLSPINVYCVPGRNKVIHHTRTLAGR
jgi:DNA-binding beta-propeller fold protein YncE